MRRRLRPAALVVLTAVLSSSLAGVTTAQPTAAAARYCHGKPATIVGEPGDTVSGTQGDDVIVTHGADFVESFGGADTICVTGGSDERYAVVHVHAGNGDDLVDASLSTSSVSAVLGGGEDTFVGSPQGDGVDAAGGGADRVDTGGGGDGVSAGGLKGRPDHDVVHLGPGEDVMHNGNRDRTTRWYGDAGSDLILLPHTPCCTGVEHDWVYDNVRHATFRDGRAVERWWGFERFRVDVTRSARFVGGPGRQEVSLSAVRPGDLVRLNLGGGHDVVEFRTPQDRDLSFRYVLTGGAGRDLLRLVGRGIGAGPGSSDRTTPYLDVDLTDQSFGLTRGGGPLGSLKGFEDVDAAYFDRADLSGDASDNQLLSPQSCTGRLTGGGGDDVLAVGRIDDGKNCDEDDQPGPVPGATLDGGTGDDVLTGGFGDDTLTGGEGTDTADGGPGFDACTAETTTSCESP